MDAQELLRLEFEIILLEKMKQYATEQIEIKRKELEKINVNTNTKS